MVHIWSITMLKDYVQLKVFPKTRSKFERLKGKLGMTQDGLTNHLVNFYLEESKDVRLRD